MPEFGSRSREHLKTLHPSLQRILVKAIEIIDFSILEGFRDEEKQNEAFREGKSKLQYPQSKHNTYPSQAVDVAPYPIDWQDSERFTLLAGILKGIAHTMSIKLRWGGDWNSNNITKDQTFDDLPHFELLED
jgi:peptidoglycan L-alanyl-D-glutamate endopeptidase CwlK